MKKCLKKCILEEEKCQQQECRGWINYGEDLNCSFLSIAKHKVLTLEQVAKRMNLSIVRVN